MITFEDGNSKFNYRVAGIVIHENAVLLHRSEEEAFWTFPGGRAEFGEPAEETLKREIREEIGVEVEVVRLLWFVENFFAYEGKRCHEIGLYFLMRLPADCEYLFKSSFQGAEGNLKLLFKWFSNSSDVLSSLPLLPSFLQTALQNLPQSAQHIVHADEN